VADQRFGIRLEVSGGAAVEQGLAAIAQAGERAMATVAQRTDQASASVQRFARTANDNLAGSGGLAGAFDRLDSRAKTVSRSVGDVAGALQLVGGAGGTAERGLNTARTAIGGIADVAATASLALGGAGGAGLLGVLTRFAGIVGVAVTAFTAFQAVMRAVQGSTAQNATSAADLTRAYQTLAQASETAEERQRRLRGEQIAGIEAAARLVQETERLNLTQAQAARTAALSRVGNLQGQLSEEERVQGAAGSRVTGVQRGRLEALRNEARAAAEALEQANEAITRAQTGINRAGAQGAIGVANANNPPAASGGRAGAGPSRADQAATLEASLNRIAAAEGQPRVSTQALEAGRRVIEETATATEKYEARISELNDLLAAGAIDQETYSRGVAQADQAVAGVTRRTEGYSKSFSQLGDAISEFATSVAFDFSNIGRAAESLARTLANTIFRQTVGNQISSGITDLLGSVLGGGNSGQLSLGKLFSSSASGGVKGFAEGGRPPVGIASLVGERGPELFVPDSAGTILPNGVMPRSGGGGNVVSITINAPGAGPEVEGKINAAIPRIKAEVFDAIRRGGEASRIVRRA
jgi:hypothetical protein